MKNSQSDLIWLEAAKKQPFTEETQPTLPSLKIGFKLSMTETPLRYVV
jgi:hypothetical protein